MIFTLPQQDLVCLIFFNVALQKYKTRLTSISNTCIRSWNSVTQSLDSQSKLQILLPLLLYDDISAALQNLLLPPRICRGDAVIFIVYH